MTSTWPCPSQWCHEYPASPLLPSAHLPQYFFFCYFVFSVQNAQSPCDVGFFSFFWGGGGRDTYSTLLNFVCLYVFFPHLPNSFYWKTTRECVKQFYFNFFKKAGEKKNRQFKKHFSPLFFFKSDTKLAQWSESVFMGLYLCFFPLNWVVGTWIFVSSYCFYV